MTREKINEYIALRWNLAKDVTILDALRNTAEPRAQILTGMPHAPGFSDKTGELAVEIADISTEIEKMQDRIKSMEPEMLDFIESIQDVQVRIIFRLRLLHTMSWQEIAKAVGGRNSTHGVRNTYYRNLKKLCLRDTP